MGIWSRQPPDPRLMAEEAIADLWAMQVAVDQVIALVAGEARRHSHNGQLVDLACDVSNILSKVRKGN